MLETIDEEKRKFMQDMEEVIRAGRKLKGWARYSFTAMPHQTPFVVSCQTFVWLLYRAHGGIIPWLLSELLYWGIPVEGFLQAGPGNLVFSRRKRGYVFYDSMRAKNGVGHVGIFTGTGVLHASLEAGTVVEESVEDFLGEPGMFRGIYRVPKR